MPSVAATRSSLALPLTLALTLVAAATGCKKAGRVDLLLRPPENLDLASASEVEVRLLDGRDDHELARDTVPGSGLAGLPEAISRSDMNPGVPYVFEVRAAVDEGTCSSGRIVGRSLPITIASDDSMESATMYVACANAAAPAARMNNARVLHGAIWAAEQLGALVVGGVSDLGALGNYTPLDSVERYDVPTGRFTETPSLLEARFAPAVALDAEGRVVVLGGGDANFLPGSWLDTVEEIDGEARRGKGLLDTKWLRPIVLPLSDGTFALLGIGYEGLQLAQVAFYDPAQERPPRDFMTRTAGQYNGLPVPMPGRDRALLVGATADREEVRPTLFCAPNTCCGQDACLTDLGDPDDRTTWGPGVGWQEAAGAWLSCPTGDGTVTITGGRLGDGSGPLGDIYCYQDSDPPSGGLTRIGVLNHPRWAHGMIAVRPGSVLVVGGTNGTQDSIEQAELLHVDPCSCDPLAADDVEDIVIDEGLGRVGRSLVGGSEIVLGDGSVLLTGAASLANGSSIAADDEAWIFMPDLGP